MNYVPFNPHQNQTSDGVVITLGMRVLTYDYEVGHVVGDAHESIHSANQCGGDHWFAVEEEATGHVSIFNGARLKSSPGPVVHLHTPVRANPVCGAPIPEDRAKRLTAYRSEVTCEGCLATLSPSRD